MGLISSVFGYGNKPMRILILGLGGVGKTTLLYKIVTSKTVRTTRTFSFNVEPFKHNNVNLSLWDAGRGERIDQLLRHYYPGTKGIIFVIDSTEFEDIDQSEYELRKLFQTEEFKNAPFLIYANKQDQPNAMSTNELIKQYKLDDWKTHRVHVQPSSATEGSGLHEGLDWLCGELKKY